MKTGFTLIELLVGIALVGILLGTANVMLYSSLQGAKKAEALGVTKSEGALAMKAMTDKIKYARQWLSCSGNSLQIERLNGDKITYTVGGDKIASAGASLDSSLPIANVDLTSSQVTVENCTAKPFFSCPNAYEVNICFRVSRNSSCNNTSDTSCVTFDTTLSVRNVDN